MNRRRYPLGPVEPAPSSSTPRISDGVEWMNTKTTAKYLDTSPGNIRNMKKRGILRGHYLAGRLRFRRSEVDQALGSSKSKGGIYNA